MNAGPKRVLIATDGSEPADLAVDLVADGTWPPDTRFEVVTVAETGVGAFGGPWPTLAVVQAERIEATLEGIAQRTARAAGDRLTQAGLQAEAVVLHGRPASAIVERSRVFPADLVVLGSRGHGQIESMLLGSVSAEVVDHAPAPVLVARGPRTERIVLAWDGSSCASRAADLVRTWPMLARCHVRVVSVAPVVTPWWTGFPESGSPELMPFYLDALEATRKHHDELALDMKGRLESAGLAVEAERRDGDPATEILGAAANADADLIVLGTHGRTGLARLFLGSVARNVLQHAATSVLVVRDGPSRD